MDKNHLHIISFDIPYPANYGGVVDVFYKLKALSQCGVKIILHCFEYGRAHSNELNKWCEEVNYYPRKTQRGIVFGNLPYIVASRVSDKLFKRLQQDHFPILMEGLHSTYTLAEGKIADRFIMVRTHNIEHDYYNHLALQEKNIFKRSYFKRSASNLKRYEPVLKSAKSIAAISPADTSYFQNKFGSAFYLPAFHPNEHISCKTGKGTFALYHGNLSVAENNEAALFLVREVFSKCNVPLLISGSKPSKELQQAVLSNPNIQLRSNDTPEKILELIEEAHINILPTFQSTGIKLKLITALFRGRFCIVNTPMIAETGLGLLCIVADSAQLMVNAIDVCFANYFSTDEMEKRKAILEKNFSNKANAELLLQKIKF